MPGGAGSRQVHDANVAFVGALAAASILGIPALVIYAYRIRTDATAPETGGCHDRPSGRAARVEFVAVIRGDRPSECPATSRRPVTRAAEIYSLRNFWDRSYSIISSGITRTARVML
jgi:hypothetical protein